MQNPDKYISKSHIFHIKYFPQSKCHYNSILNFKHNKQRILNFLSSITIKSSNIIFKLSVFLRIFFSKSSLKNNYPLFSSLQSKKIKKHKNHSYFEKLQYPVKKIIFLSISKFPTYLTINH